MAASPRFPAHDKQLERDREIRDDINYHVALGLGALVCAEAGEVLTLGECFRGSRGNPGGLRSRRRSTAVRPDYLQTLQLIFTFGLGCRRKLYAVPS